MSASPGPTPRIVGRYAICEPIATGGMGAVHLGRLRGEAGFSRIVAIKQLHAQHARDPDFVTMFHDEARLAARISHPNVAATIDVVVADGELLLVMEYVAGESLARLLRAAENAGQRVPLSIATTIMAGALHGLHAAHEATDDFGAPLGMVHRDVSPQNILVGSDGVARVVDFGVAKAAGRLQYTRPGETKGKLAFMSPEQLRGDAVTRASDIYSTALVLWELVAGRRVFVAGEGLSLDKVQARFERPPSQYAWSSSKTTLRDDEMALLRRVDEVILRAVDPDPQRRYATALEMAVALEEAAPMAPQSVVGQWVQGLAGAQLAERAAMVRRVEQQWPSGSWSSVGLVPAADPAPGSRVPTLRLSEVAARDRSAPPPPSMPAPPPSSQHVSGTLRVGDLAPDVDAVTTSGARLVLSRSTKACTVVFFFPKAFTATCTREATLFRDTHAELTLAGVDLVGVSTDSLATQCAFAAATKVRYPLIADSDGAISRAYGVLWPILGIARRVTFIIDRTMRIQAIFRHSLRVREHRDDVLRFVDEVVRARR